jgi:hypothetical protein
VGRISVEALSEDLATLDEVVVGDYPVMLGEAAITKAWRRTQRSGCMRRGPSGGQ